jgi:dihydroorotate dehydrogenase electron transfer subunit
VASEGAAHRVEARVVALEAEGATGHRLVLDVPHWDGFVAGQFVMLSPGPRDAVPRTDPLLPRPMAVYREREGDAGRIEILFKRHGRGTALLAQSRPGDHVGVVGPLGQGFPLELEGARALLVAGGTGIASVYELAAQLASRATPAHVQVLLGARTASDLMAEADFEALGVGVSVATEDGSRGQRGLVTELLEAALAEDGNARVFACGPTPMMRRASEVAAAHGAPCSVSLENPMACGFGVCLGCAAPLAAGGFALVCRDGPVFDARDVRWEGLP